MTLLNDLSSDLSEAAGRRARRRARRRRLRLSGITVAGVLAVGGVATAATGVWSPQLGDEHRGHPAASASSVPPEQLKHFAVLRRPANEADRGAQSRYALKFLDPKFHGVRTDAVRLLDPGKAGDRVSGAQVLVPVQRRDGIDDALCLFSTDPTDGGGISCWSTKQILDGQATMGMALPDEPAPGSAEAQDRARALRAATRRAKARGERGVQMPWRMTIREAVVAGIVPDGVARVVWRHGEKTQTVPVENNLFTVRIDHPKPASADRPDEQSTLTWQDASGTDLRTVHSGF